MSDYTYKMPDMEGYIKSGKVNWTARIFSPAHVTKSRPTTSKGHTKVPHKVTLFGRSIDPWNYPALDLRGVFLPVFSILSFAFRIVTHLPMC